MNLSAGEWIAVLAALYACWRLIAGARRIVLENRPDPDPFEDDE